MHGWPRIGRQFYDVWELLGSDEVIQFLSDKPLAAEVLSSCYEVSEAFTPDFPVPEGGFAASLAFVEGGPLAARLKTEHDLAMDGLYYGMDSPPSFDEVLSRVREHAALLNVG